MERKLSDIAREIWQDWQPISPYARPYVTAMRQLSTIDDNFGADSGKSIVLYFLCNAQSWRGETARRVKAELRGMVK